MKESPNFKNSEIECHDGCGFADCVPALFATLETIRTHFGAAVVIDDACRCAVHNAAVGGEPNSYHMKGMAADIKVVGVSPTEVYSWLDFNHQGGVGKYDTFTHVDVGPAGRRWDKT